MRRHLALAVAAMLIVLSSSTHSNAITADQKGVCNVVLNECIFICYENLGTDNLYSRQCTTNCTKNYRRCKRTGKPSF